MAGRKGSLCKLYCGRAADTAGGPSNDGNATLVDDRVYFVVHGRDGVVRTGAEGGGPAAGVGGSEDHGINIRVVRRKVRELEKR